MELEHAVKNLRTLRSDRTALDEALRLIAEQLEEPIVQREWSAIREIARQVATEKDPPAGCVALLDAAIRRLDPNKESMVNLIQSLTMIQTPSAMAALRSLVAEDRIPFNDAGANLNALVRVHFVDERFVDARLNADTPAEVLNRFAQQARCAHAARLLLARGLIAEEVFDKQDPLRDMSQLCLATGVGEWIERTLARFETLPWFHKDDHAWPPDRGEFFLDVPRAGDQLYLLWELWTGGAWTNGLVPRWPDFAPMVEQWLVGHWRRLATSFGDDEDSWLEVLEAVEDRYSGHLEKRLRGAGEGKGHVSSRSAGGFWRVLAETIVRARVPGELPLQLAEDWFLAYLESEPSDRSFSPDIAELLASAPVPDDSRNPSYAMLRMLGRVGPPAPTDELLRACLSDPEYIWQRLFEIDTSQRRDVILALLESVVDGRAGEGLIEALADLHDAPPVDAWSLSLESILLKRIEERADDPPKRLFEALKLIPRDRALKTLRRIEKARERSSSSAHPRVKEARLAITKALGKDQRDWQSLGERWERALEVLRAG